MLLPDLRRAVLEANLELVRQGLVSYTFGNASGISRKHSLVVIKPSGVPYDRMKPGDLLVTDLNGKTVEGKLRPSSDLATHLVLYKSFPTVGGVSHTHSEYATAWAQARRAIPCFGTTHADYFHGAVPVTEELSYSEISSSYEENTGQAIVRTFDDLDYCAIPAVLVANHGAFTWGPDPETSAHNAVILESVARMAYMTITISAEAQAIERSLHDKHFLRKHGKDAYYGQPKEKK
jgi:L-ribulose-5-phosphate 4-epimerase